ncbi:DUF4234 domain-containing protein [uncultured Anaerococcus sp.]|uniref:DUF4234 domain-containing protein n=1 Tax=uncultured Anaerococcus sp. TaxID=293428 RepID=UPI00288922D1|nr:DUF4234 domain-containing protein [uncultured Anaerococcus sp.]
MFGYLISSLFNILASALSVFSIVFVAYSLLTVARQWDKGNHQDLFNLLVISGCFLVIVRIFDLIVKSTSFYYEFKPIVSVFLILIAVCVPVSIYLISTSSGDTIYEDGYFDKLKDTDFMKAEVIAAFSLFLKEIEKVSSKLSKQVNETNSKNKVASDEEAYKYTEDAGDFKGMLKEKRSLLLFIILNIITCGIYFFYFVHTTARDANIACAGDGEQTSGLLKYIIFSILTCGVYCFYWDYALANRLAANGPRYGYNIQENGSTYLLWLILGWWLCGLGALVARNITIKNLNKVCRGYNQANPRF